MTHEHGAAQVERFEDRLEVTTEVFERVPFFSEHRATVAAMVERDRPEALLRKLLALMETRAERQSDAVREDDRRIELIAALDDVDRAAVVRVEPVIDVRRGI